MLFTTTAALMAKESLLHAFTSLIEDHLEGWRDETFTFPQTKMPQRQDFVSGPF